MTEKQYIDIHERILGAYDSLVKVAVSLGAIGSILIEKGICTDEELARMMDTVRNSGQIDRLTNAIADRKAEIEELKKEAEKDPLDMFMDLFKNAGKKEEPDEKL